MSSSGRRASPRNIPEISHQFWCLSLFEAYPSILRNMFEVQSIYRDRLNGFFLQVTWFTPGAQIRVTQSFGRSLSVYQICLQIASLTVAHDAPVLDHEQEVRALYPGTDAALEHAAMERRGNFWSLENEGRKRVRNSALRELKRDPSLFSVREKQRLPNFFLQVPWHNDDKLFSVGCVRGGEIYLQRDASNNFLFSPLVRIYLLFGHPSPRPPPSHPVRRSSYESIGSNV